MNALTNYLTARLEGWHTGVERAAWHVRDGACWALAARRGLRVPRGPYSPAHIRGVLYSDLPNPFEPLIDLWNTGYGIHEVDARAITLVYPRP